MVQLRYTWVVSRDVIEVKSGETYGVFEATATSTHLILKLDSSIDLSADSTNDLGGNFKIKVADDNTAFRFYPLVERTIEGVSDGEAIRHLL